MLRLNQVYILRAKLYVPYRKKFFFSIWSYNLGCLLSDSLDLPKKEKKKRKLKSQSEEGKLLTRRTRSNEQVN